MSKYFNKEQNKAWYLMLGPPVLFSMAIIYFSDSPIIAIGFFVLLILWPSASYWVMKRKTEKKDT